VRICTIIYLASPPGSCISGGHRAHGTISSTAPPIQTSAHPGEDLDHVAHQIIGRLPILDDHDAPPLRGQRRTQMLDPKQASRSRYSTTITLAQGSDKIPDSFARLPFDPEPTSATTWPTSHPAGVAHSVSRDT
jgi:hypothetical protein